MEICPAVARPETDRSHSEENGALRSGWIRADPARGAFRLLLEPATRNGFQGIISASLRGSGLLQGGLEPEALPWPGLPLSPGDPLLERLECVRT